ncbi:prepilin-type N-terminal cleavage/methylation domain-containing protein [Microbacterium sp. NPDC058062]|uniref:prepilin-type N-terminal cleavage/methylation domain-containing protein n=1 Tax=Microbacterium sp. NPDC058062 TaxID=3346320 RepID=UPI0036DDE750
MRDTEAGTSGFSLIELVVAMFLLAVLAVSLLPALIQGIQLSATQSAVATATRQLNTLVEDVRQAPSCASIAVATATTNAYVDGKGRPFQTQGIVHGVCAAGSTTTISLTATRGTTTLASVDAIIYVPAAP